MAHKKSGGSSRNGRDSNSKRLGVKRFGGEDVLTSTIDRGFNRLAGAFPYVLGTSAALVVGAMAFRWSRRDGSSDADRTAAAPAVGSASLEARLDDELRDLD